MSVEFTRFSLIKRRNGHYPIQYCYQGHRGQVMSDPSLRSR